ncbi:MAG: DUF4125 family protein [Desulfovibrio sp.]|jgi:hypothetical protein|nr:DUF4125 family protein [Desulfovibrio sp.]
MKKAGPADIVRLEWEMFAQVSNTGGKASCQADPATFEIMRSSQVETWPGDVLESWFEDLAAAGREGRNLMSEKYARMMKSAFPDEYRKIADRLPSVDDGTLALIEHIVAANLAWKLETAEKYPLLGEKGRPAHTGEDSPWATSFETYLRGELETYSPETVRRLYRHTRNLRDAGINGVEQVLLNQVRKYGYASLEEAEAAQAGRMQSKNAIKLTCSDSRAIKNP